jgi:hypothetical protein
MNGHWHPYSAVDPDGSPRDADHSTAAYIGAWRRLRVVFRGPTAAAVNRSLHRLGQPPLRSRRKHAVGAPAVRFVWAPNIGSQPPVPGNAPSAYYPGDAYVDWVGATVYWRRTNQPTDYRSNFGATIDQLRAVTQKPMFFAEIGALQTDRASSAKQEWMANTLRGFLADPTIVGFSWFNNNILVPSEDPTAAHDWRFNASAPTLAAFKQQITDPRFAGGILPDQ